MIRRATWTDMGIRRPPPRESGRAFSAERADFIFECADVEATLETAVQVGPEGHPGFLKWLL